jgi:hypothetical protein
LATARGVQQLDLIEIIGLGWELPSSNVGKLRQAEQPQLTYVAKSRSANRTFFEARKAPASKISLNIS